MALFPSTASRVSRSAILAAVMTLAIVGRAWTGTALDTQAAGELQVRAAFLFNFAKFVEWPAAGRPLVICIAGNAALATVAEQTVRGRLVDARPVAVRSLAATRPVDGCDLLYLADLSADDASALLSRVRGAVLTVGETARFLRDGGMVRVFIEDNRMRFQVNLKQTEAAGLKISSQLLSLASQ